MSKDENGTLSVYCEECKSDTCRHCKYMKKAWSDTD